MNKPLLSIFSFVLILLLISQVSKAGGFVSVENLGAKHAAEKAIRDNLKVKYPNLNSISFDTSVRGKFSPGEFVDFMHIIATIKLEDMNTPHHEKTLECHSEYLHVNKIEEKWVINFNKPLEIKCADPSSEENPRVCQIWPESC